MNRTPSGVRLFFDWRAYDAYGIVKHKKKERVKGENTYVRHNQ